MKNILAVLFIVHCQCILFAAPDVVIIDLEKWRTIGLPCGELRQSVLALDNERELIYTLRKGWFRRWYIYSYSFTGKTVKHVRLPIFCDSLFQGYAGGRGWYYALSPDASRLAYYNDAIGDIEMFDIQNNTKSVLAKHAAPSDVSMRFTEWISNDELVIGVDTKGRGKPEQNGIFRINKNINSRKRILLPNSLENFKNNLSFDRQYLAYWEGVRPDSIYGHIKIYDLIEEKEVAKLGNANGSSFTSPVWNSSRHAIAYFENTTLTTYDLQKHDTIKMLQVSGGLIKGYTGNIVVFHKIDSSLSKVAEKERASLFFVDMETKKQKKFEHIWVNGNGFVSKSGRFLIIETGY